MATPSELEVLAARAWPAAEAVARGGWLLRHTPAAGRRRSNSALPLPGSRPDDAAVALVEDWYRARGAAPVVQVAPADERGALDALLDGRGWAAGGATDVLVADAGDVAAAAPGATSSRASPAPGSPPGPPRRAARTPSGHRGILAAVPPPAGFAAVHDGGRPLAVGLCAVEGAWGGVFCLATAPAARRRGLARGVLAALAAWAAGRGAERLYLQVEAGNAAAHALFAERRLRALTRVPLPDRHPELTSPGCADPASPRSGPPPRRPSPPCSSPHRPSRSRAAAAAGSAAAAAEEAAAGASAAAAGGAGSAAAGRPPAPACPS